MLSDTAAHNEFGTCPHMWCHTCPRKRCHIFGHKMSGTLGPVCSHRKLDAAPAHSGIGVHSAGVEHWVRH